MLRTQRTKKTFVKLLKKYKNNSMRDKNDSLSKQPQDLVNAIQKCIDLLEKNEYELFFENMIASEIKLELAERNKSQIIQGFHQRGGEVLLKRLRYIKNKEGAFSDDDIMTFSLPWHERIVFTKENTGWVLMESNF